MIQLFSAAMMPSGAIWTAPVPLIVVTITSRIIGIGSLRRRGAQRVADLAEARAILGRAIDRATPVERLVLHISLAETPRDLGPHQFRAEVERMSAVAADVELLEQGERILSDMMCLAIV